MIARFALGCVLSALLGRHEDPPVVSYYKDVRPILAQHCNGCHQPAKPQGGYITTGHADLLKAGERGKAGVVPGKPAASYVVEQIKVHDNGKFAQSDSGEVDWRLDCAGGEGRYARQREGRGR